MLQKQHYEVTSRRRPLSKRIVHSDLLCAYHVVYLGDIMSARAGVGWGESACDP